MVVDVPFSDTDKLLGANVLQLVVGGGTTTLRADAWFAYRRVTRGGANSKVGAPIATLCHCS